MKSEKFNMIKDFYDAGTWNIDRVRNVVEKKALTKEEYKEITGFDYASVESTTVNL